MYVAFNPFYAADLVPRLDGWFADPQVGGVQAAVQLLEGAGDGRALRTDVEVRGPPSPAGADALVERRAGFAGHGARDRQQASRPLAAAGALRRRRRGTPARRRNWPRNSPTSFLKRAAASAPRAAGRRRSGRSPSRRWSTGPTPPRTTFIGNWGGCCRWMFRRTSSRPSWGRTCGAFWRAGSFAVHGRAAGVNPVVRAGGKPAQGACTAFQKSIRTSETLYPTGVRPTALQDAPICRVFPL